MCVCARPATTSLRAIDEFTVIKGKLSSAMNLDKIHIHMQGEASAGGGEGVGAAM